jgi:RimJ/RimL family protein N-acetyltransferase
MLDSSPSPLWSAKKATAWFEKDLERDLTQGFDFGIRTLVDGRLIGFVALFGLRWSHGDTLVGIGIGEPEDWGKGYGTDAMRVLLRYAFTELGLHRVSLGVFEYNPRAIRSYQKAGFQIEGRERQLLLREGRRWDALMMGILREEWENCVEDHVPGVR